MLIAQTDTAIDSYHAHRAAGHSAIQRDRILECIAQRGGDWSIGELARELGMEKSTISARVNECLYETHELVEMPKRKDRISEVTVRPVGLPVRQWRLF